MKRRTLLRGMLHGTTVSLGVPLLEAMLDGNGTALAGGRPIPRRLGIFFWGNGVKLDRWVPKVEGAAWNLSEELMPLGHVKKYVSVVSGMDVMTGNEQGHHAGCVGILSGAPMVSQPHATSAYSSTFSVPSIDQVVAHAIGRSTAFRSLEVGVCRDVTANEGTTLKYLSHRGPDNACPPEYDPAKVFDRLFASAGSPAERAMGRSILDVVGQDAQSLRNLVGVSDRHRLDQHLDNIREMENRLVEERPRLAGCRAPRRFKDALAARREELDGKEPMEEINDAMARVLALALSCDLTRVFSVMFSGSVGTNSYWQVGETRDHHVTTHDEGADQPVVHAATTFIVKQFGRLLGVLQKTSEGSGNLLDSCAILGTSDLNEGKLHKCVGYPILIAGRAGGALTHPGIHYRSNHENTSKVLLTLLRAVGLPLQAFGEKGGRVTESCRAIEAGG